MSSFLSRHKKEWEELESLVQRSRGWFHRLSSAERDRLDELYRRTTVHLARVSSKSADPTLQNYLNQLCASAHSEIYLSARESLVTKVMRFASEGFARAISRTLPYHLWSAGLVLAGGLIGYYAAFDPELAHALWPSNDPRQPGSTPEQLLFYLRDGRDGSGGEKFFFASFLFQHNLRVAILALATGVLAAIPTVFLMIFNGMLLGVFASIHHQANIYSELWAWLLPHGITEFGAIILCAGVGLMLGAAIVKPGQQSRRQSLLRTGREAARICTGAAGMLVLAAIIESYVRQSHWQTASRLIFAATTGGFWIVYIGFGYYCERRQRIRSLCSTSDSVPLTANSADATQ